MDSDLSALDHYLSLIGLIGTEQDVHQCSLACTIFTQKTKDVSFTEVEINIVICLNCSKTLADALHTQQIIWIGHNKGKEQKYSSETEDYERLTFLNDEE
jgi:hypothetical protein